MQSVSKRSFTHWSMVGWFMDVFCVFISVAVIFAIASGTSSDGNSGVGGTVVVGIIAAIISLAVIFRKSRFVIESSDTTVTVKSYRVFGLFSFSRDKKDFAHDELGALVLDTQLRNSCFSWSNCLCCCCCGFNGIYVTKGYPRDNASLQIAFEIPFYHLTQYSPLYHVCHVRTFETSFKGLIDCLQFTPAAINDSHSQVTTPGHVEVIRGDWATHQMAMVHNMQSGMDAISDDVKANYRNFLAYNRNCKDRTPRTKIGGKGIVQNRAVYFFPEGPEQAPVPVSTPVAVPIAAPVIVAIPVAAPTPKFPAADFDLVRARNKATLDQLMAIWTSNDYNKMIQSIPSLYRPDYACSNTVDQQASTYGKYTDLPAGFNYIFNTLQGKYYNCEVLPDQDGDPCIIRGRNKVRYPTSEYDCWFTVRFDDRGLMAFGDYFAQKCS